MPDLQPHPLDVTADGPAVRIKAPGAEAVALTPEAAVRTAERLLEAAEQALGGEAASRVEPPFEPAKLVSPHAAG